MLSFRRPEVGGWGRRQRAAGAGIGYGNRSREGRRIQRSPARQLAVSPASPEAPERAGRNHGQRFARQGDPGGPPWLRPAAVRSGGADDGARAAAGRTVVHRGPCRETWAGPSRPDADCGSEWRSTRGPVPLLANYRRNGQPNEPAALVLPRSVRVTSRNRIPEKLETIGDYILRRRLSLKLLQKQVAQQLGAKLSTIRSWEANRGKPTVVGDFRLQRSIKAEDVSDCKVRASILRLTPN
jgi:DNA-binding transcriptional regulator YiaG